ncbi:chaplin [Streptomyces sp. NBC_00853]|uniref:chaplin n=1 Tax=unclassified Streptomyces TaxID=2593676 RepID=UPI0036B66AD9|nr:chaplin [Streptomyces sp. NBC_00853]
MVRVFKSLAVAAAAGVVVIGGASLAAADAGAQGVAAYSPGVGSGNLIQVPIHIPVNACGNTVSIIGLLNPSFGNTCINA